MIGANDILEVDRAKSVIVLERSMRPGFAGVDNDLDCNENCMMLSGRARQPDEALRYDNRTG